MNRFLPRASLLFIFLTAAGCAPLDTRYAPVEVVIDVRDAISEEPIDDASILGGVNVLFNPDMKESSLGRGGGIPSFVVVNEPSEWIVHTNEKGFARTQIAGGNPTSMTILKDGYLAAHGLIEANVASPGADQGWTEGVAQPTAHGLALPGKRLEFRVLPAPRP